MESKKGIKDGKTAKFYTVTQIAEMLDVTRTQTWYAIRLNKIKPVKTLRPGGLCRPSNLFNITVVNKIRRHFLRIDREKAERQQKNRENRQGPQASKKKRFETPSYLPKKSNAISDEMLGMHDEECTELLRAVDRYKRENRTRYGMTVSDYLKVFKSMPKQWIKNLLSKL